MFLLLSFIYIPKRDILKLLIKMKTFNQNQLSTKLIFFFYCYLINIIRKDFKLINIHMYYYSFYLSFTI